MGRSKQKAKTFNIFSLNHLGIFFVVTINSPLLYIGRGIIILLREKPLRGPFQGVGHENRDF